jgi:uncharacterized protein YihD (DUF1040 family)
LELNAPALTRKELTKMRDSKRIDKFCEILKAYWHMVPDWRFMQLVCNLQAQIGSDGFYLEDDQAMELIEQMLKGE